MASMLMVIQLVVLIDQMSILMGAQQLHANHQVLMPLDCADALFGFAGEMKEEEVMMMGDFEILCLKMNAVEIIGDEIDFLAH